MNATIIDSVREIVQEIGVSDENDIDDVVSDTLFKLIGRPLEFESDFAARKYLLMTAQSAYNDHRMKAQRRKRFTWYGVCNPVVPIEDDFDVIAETVKQEELDYREEIEKRLEDAMIHLTPRQDQVIRLMVNGLSDQEIADQLNVKIRTVYVTKHGALKKLREKA